MATHGSISVLCEAVRGATVHGQGPVPMGLLPGTAPTMGSLLFVTRPSEDLRRAAVYYTQAHYGYGPFVGCYEHLGNVAQVYPRLPFDVVGGEVELMSESLSVLCGDRCRITLAYASEREVGGLDVYMQTYPQVPPDLYSHFVVQGDDPMEWWRCRSYAYHGPVYTAEPMAWRGSARTREAGRAAMSILPAGLD